MCLTVNNSSENITSKGKDIEDILFTPNFNNAAWRQLLSQVCQDIDVSHVGLEVISPFGFEILKDNKKFLAGNLRRFYCYIGAPLSKHLDGDMVAAQYTEALLRRLRSMETRMSEDIVVVVQNKNFFKLKEEGYSCKPTDKLIDIQFRSVEKDILTDYANYIITTLGSLLSEEGEFKGHGQDRRLRWHMYQLYIIEEELFGEFISPMNAQQSKIYQTLPKEIKNMIQIFYSPELRYALSDNAEEDILNQLILPRLTLIQAAVNSAGTTEKTKVTSISYHYGTKLEFTLDSSAYHYAIDKIKNTYLSFI